MKQTNLLKTFLLLCALVVGSTCAWADEESVDFTEQGYTNHSYHIQKFFRYAVSSS